MRLPFQISQRYALYGLGFLIILLCIYTVVGERGPIHLWRLRAEKAKLDERNYDLQKDNETLRQRIWRLRHDNFYLEKLAREELNLVRPGEVIYRFPSADSPKNRGKSLREFSSESHPPPAERARR
jgi:cell division protein FtsB